jgi:predicted ATPase
VISAATHRLIQGFFTCSDLGFQTLKGVARPVHVYGVLGVSAAQSRLEVTATKGLTPLIGRESEVTLLLKCWEEVKDGVGQVVVLSGEPGIGKSRLVQVLKEHLAGEPHTRLEWRGSPYYQQSPLYPAIKHLHRLLRRRQEEAPEENLRKLQETLEPYGLSLPDVVPLFASLLSLPIADRYPPLTLTPQRQKQKTLEAMLAWLLAEAKRQPVLFIVEDLHWVDPTTLEWLGLLIDQAPTTRIFTVLTYRPEFHPPWHLRAYLIPITLSRLPHHQTAVMVERVVGRKALPTEVVQQIVAKTDGVPLFVEELTKMVLESGLLLEQEDRYELTDPLPPLAIPATLHDSLMARLDRLAVVKELAQLAATLGREFPYALLRAVWPLDEVTLQQALARLVEAELLYQRGVPPHAIYLFKHALIQDAAYQSLLKSRRQQYHLRIAQVLEEQFRELVETRPELMAHHCTGAGLVELAISYWQKAGEIAAQSSANVEAVAHFTRGLALLKALPDTIERNRRELDLQTRLGTALIASKGYAAPEVKQAYIRAQELCQQVGDTLQLFAVMRGLWWFCVVHQEFQTARELAERLLTLAEGLQDPAYHLEAHRALGQSWLYLGEFVPARTHLEEGMALYDPQQHRSHAVRYGSDPGVACLSYGARTLWFLGYPDQALKRSYEGLSLARTFTHSLSLAQALGMIASLHQIRRERQLTQEWAERTVEYATEQGIPYWSALAAILRSWALAKQGQWEMSIVQMRHNIGVYQATGARLGCSWFLAQLAEIYGESGQAEEGLRVLAEALALIDNTGEGYYEAESHRLKGELLLRKEGTEATGAAEACFRQSLMIARRQGSKSWELRTATSLARLWHEQDKLQEARALLAPIYDWFTEGFDTADLQDARRLLDELSAAF